MPANDGFNGSVLTFGGDIVGKLRDFSWDDDAGEVDVTSLDNVVHVSVGGIPAIECTAEIVGVSDLGTGSTNGVLNIDWNDGSSTTSTATFRVSKASISGSLDSEMTTSITFMPTTS